jgi:plasmid stabilization system protein ParE
MAKRVEFRDKAKRDYRQTFRWYLKRSPQAALGFSDEVEDAADRIAATRNAFPKRVRAIATARCGAIRCV